MAVAVAVAVAVSGGGAVAVAGLTKRFFNHIQKDFLINVWVYVVRTYVQNPGRRARWPLHPFITLSHLLLVLTYVRTYVRK